MRRSNLKFQAVVLIGIASLTACGGGHDKTADVSAANSSVAPTTTTPVATADTVAGPHHSKMAGAAIGAVAGHMLGGHAVAGAAVGAIVQHERNKHRKY